MAKLSDPVTMLKGVGEVRAKQLAQLNIFTLRDLICHFPRGYEDRTKLVPIEKLEPDVPACFRAMVMNTPRTSHIRKGLDLTKVQVADSTGRLNVTFFNSRFAAQQLEYGREYIFYGAVSGDFIGYSMTNPVFEAPESQPVTTRRILPIYPLTAGLTNAALLRLVQQALAVCGLPEEILPAEVREKYGILPAERAYFAIHEPNSMAEAELAKKRMIFEEFFVFSAGLALMRAAQKEKKTEPYTDFDMAPFYDSLPFTLTGAQSRAVGEILEDFRRGIPMNRLVQGDVGSGKTAVAQLAMYKSVKAGFQAVMMAPTELLAKQHLISLKRDFEPIGIKVDLLCSSLKAKEKKQVLEDLESGDTDILVGTHAIIQPDVKFKSLGLVITDEQHRFGVNQRSLLAEKGSDPNVLVMTATPIPRTLAVILYGDLDISVIDTMPKGRRPIRTFLRSGESREDIYNFVRQQVREGRQAYVVAPLIEESENIDCRSAEEIYKELESAYPDMKIGLVHGAMKQEEKDRAMEDFAAGEIDILVSTVVIEVGIDVANANVIVIENCERFGLAQLHQLRGRVGRGKHQSYCILVSGRESKVANKRNQIMCATEDGFVIAEEDLKLRGPGEMFGTRQHGLPELNISDLVRHGDILASARQAADDILEKDGDLTDLQNIALRQKVKKMFGENIQLNL